MGKSARMWSTSNGIGSSGTSTSSSAMVAAYSGPPETDMTPTPPPREASFRPCPHIRANVPVVTLSLETFGQISATFLGNPAGHEDMDEVRLDIAQNPGVVRDQQDATITLSREAVYTVGHDSQSVDVQAGVGLVQDRESWVQQFQLNDLVSLLLTARKTLVDAPSGEIGVHLHPIHGRTDLFDPGAQLRRLTVQSSLGCTKEVRHRDAGYFDRVLHRQEQARASTRVHGECQQVGPIEGHRARGDSVLRMACDRVRQRRLA